MSATTSQTSNGSGCGYYFQHPRKPRPSCGLDKLSGSSLCLWHETRSRRPDCDLSKALEREVERPEHWLEGAILSDQPNLRGLNLFRAKLPYADFENLDLSGTVLAEACLDKAHSRGATLN